MVDKEDVKAIADLAKLSFDDEQIEQFVPSFQQMLDYFNSLREVPTENVEPTYHALETPDLATPLRADDPGVSLEPEDVMRGAPASRENQFRVPKVIE
jgi:aspartyl-tRNA(Asn)/glutamyl-tRNA(Gln) amidotransferase subunit C